MFSDNFWFCGDENADPDNEATAPLTRDHTYHTFGAQLQDRYLQTTTTIPRCASCKKAHHKVDLFSWSFVILGFILPFLAAIYYYNVINPDPKFTVGNSVMVGFFLGWISLIASFYLKNLLTPLLLPGHIKAENDVEAHPNVTDLCSRGWKLKK